MEEGGRAFVEIMYFWDEYSLIDAGESEEYHRSRYLPEKLWRALCAMADGDKPCLHFLYAETELHVPFLCGYHTVKPQKMTSADMGLGNGCSIQSLKIQFQNCLDYVDQEVEDEWL